MDLKNVINNMLYQNKLETCFLCFKKNEELVNIFQDFSIQNGKAFDEKSIHNIMIEIFSYDFQDTITTGVCNNCVTVILNIYLILNKYIVTRNIIELAVEEIFKEINKVEDLNVNLVNKVKLNISVSMDRVCYRNIPNAEDTVEIKKSEDTFEVKIEKKEATIIRKCEKCDMAFEDFSTLRKHKNYAHKKINRSVVCDVCGLVCETTSCLKSHTRCHIKKQCPHCFKYLKSHAYFQLHVKQHQTGMKKPHNNVTVYNCHICDYKSKNKNTLEAHINKAHLNIRPYVCDICCKGFYKRGNLVEHLEIHKQLKNRICHICGDSFSNKKCLTIHLRLHTGEKPYKCDQCNESFISSGRRYVHMKSKHLEKSEVCLACGKKFALKKYLNQHIRNVHMKDDVDASLPVDGGDNIFQQTNID